jgi:hypothetical protein
MVGLTAKTEFCAHCPLEINWPSGSPVLQICLPLLSIMDDETSYFDRFPAIKMWKSKRLLKTDGIFGTFTTAYVLESGNEKVQVLSNERDAKLWVDGQRAGGSESLVDVSRIVE